MVELDPMKAAGLLLTSLLVALAGPAVADPPTIVISGVGQVLTPPDVAKATFSLRGEGSTPDAATSALVKVLDAVRSGLASLPNAELSVTTDEMHVDAVRGEDCGGRYSGDATKLSTGVCAIKGYVATLEVNAEILPAEDVGTMLGLAARLGADNSGVAEFDLKDSSDAERRATAIALDDAHKKAKAIADGSGVKLGPIIMVADSMAIAMDIRPPPANKAAPSGPPQLQPRPPVAVALRPDFVVTKAQLAVTYAILP
jgi:uncharacterized protein YggE